MNAQGTEFLNEWPVTAGAPGADPVTALGEVRDTPVVVSLTTVLADDTPEVAGPGAKTVELASVGVARLSLVGSVETLAIKVLLVVGALLALLREEDEVSSVLDVATEVIEEAAWGNVEFEVAADDSGSGLTTVAGVVGGAVVVEAVSGSSPPLVMAVSPPELVALAAVVDSWRAVGTDDVSKGVVVGTNVVKGLVLVTKALVTDVLVSEALVAVSELLDEVSPVEVTVVVVEAVVEVVGVRPPLGVSVDAQSGTQTLAETEIANAATACIEGPAAIQFSIPGYWAL